MSPQDLTNFLNRALHPLKNRVLQLVGKAILAAVNDGENIQQLQVSALAGESLDKVEHFQNFGFTSNAPAGTELVFVCLGGNRDNMVVVASENRKLRKKGLASGETAIYDKDGNFICLRTGGKLELKNGSDELIKVLDDFMKWLDTARVITSMGPQPFTPDSITSLDAIRTRLETFLV